MSLDEKRAEAIRELGRNLLNAMTISKFINTIREQDKQFIKERLYDATKLLALFNKGILNSNDLREHRQKIKNDAGKGLI